MFVFCELNINDVTLAHKVICRTVKYGPSAYLSVLRWCNLTHLEVSKLGTKTRWWPWNNTRSQNSMPYVYLRICEWKDIIEQWNDMTTTFLKQRNHLPHCVCVEAAHGVWWRYSKPCITVLSVPWPGPSLGILNRKTMLNICTAV